MNTDVLGDRNCHLALVGLPPPHRDMPSCFAIARDRTHQIAGQGVPHLEIVQAVATMERFKRFAETLFIVPR